MATPSPRNFSQYSGLDRFKMQQGMPSAYDRLQNPGYERDELLKSQYSWALPISERPATAVGRSYNDPERVMERRMRGGGGGGGWDPGTIHILPNPSLGGLGASSNGQLQQSMGAGAAVIPSFGGATKGAGRKMVANAMFPNTKGYFY